MNANQAVEVRHGADLMKPLEMSAFTFDFGDVRVPVRVGVIASGVKAFVAKDIVEAVGAVWKGSQAIEHVPDEWKVVTSVVTSFGAKDAHMLTEEGVNFFLFRSDKPMALPFQKWIAGDVLPQIDRNGRYEQPRPVALLPNFEDPAAAAEAWALQFRGRTAAESERNQLRLAIAEQVKDVEFMKKYVEADGLLGVRSTCQALDIENERDFTDFLVNALRCMYRLEGALVPRAQHRHAKRFKVKTGIDHDTNRAYTTAKITAKGVTWMAREWAEYNLDRSAYIEKHAPKAGEVDEEVDEATRDEAERRAAKEAAKKGGE